MVLRFTLQGLGLRIQSVGFRVPGVGFMVHGLRSRVVVEGWGNVKRFRGGLVFKAHRLLYYSTLVLRVIKKKKAYPRRRWKPEGWIAIDEMSSGNDLHTSQVLSR